MRAIIVGGGIGGATTANALLQAGLDVALYEQACAPAEVGAGIGLWGNAVAALRRIGVAEAVLARGERLCIAEIRTARGRLLTRSTWSDYERYGSDIFALVHRAELLEELLRNLPPTVARFGHRCAGFQDDGSAVRVTFADGHTDSADLLIGADGLKSVVREQLLGPSAPRYSGYTCWRGVVDFPDHDRIPEGYVGEIWGRGARFGINRMGSNRIYWWATLNTPASPAEQGRLDGRAKQILSRSHGRFCDPVPALIESTPADRIIRNDIFDRRPSPIWTRGRVLLVGDAAHPTTPNLGQGGCMAIEDGVVLARYLKGAVADPATSAVDADDLSRRLDSFVKARYAKTAAVVRQSRLFGVTGQWENALLRKARDILTPITTKISFASMVRRYGRLDA